MRYIVTTLILILFIGCGGASNSGGGAEENSSLKVVKETFPIGVKRDKRPPAIPEI